MIFADLLGAKLHLTSWLGGLQTNTADSNSLFRCFIFKFSLFSSSFLLWGKLSSGSALCSGAELYQLAKRLNPPHVGHACRSSSMWNYGSMKQNRSVLWRRGKAIKMKWLFSLDSVCCKTSLIIHEPKTALQSGRINQCDMSLFL